ncbi:hypothetical protein DAEQUDRAFT_770745 [Daedalea quercina L-15889]|uniref:Uncharacterized protein n=1 Tax=Daedalea quercina L-15889 TaxID=1314783 RepID=A0A165KLJ8_9APHY|nr:hypothetical protein DAEQUDRAFT_770745 [Daedalea quercina L-15889]
MARPVLSVEIPLSKQPLPYHASESAVAAPSVESLASTLVAPSTESLASTLVSHSVAASPSKKASRTQRKQPPRSQQTPRVQHAHSDAIAEEYRLIRAQMNKRHVEDPLTWLEIVFYWFMSMLFAMGLSAAITAITTYASWYVLQGREPYASNFNIVYVGPLGAAILSIIPSTTMYVCDELLVRRFHANWPHVSWPLVNWSDVGRIRLPMEDSGLPQPSSRKHKAMSADWITFWLTIAYVLAGAVFGPWLGWKLNPQGAINNTMTIAATLKCGALGASMVLSIPALWLSTMYGTRMYNGGKNLDGC